METRCVLANLPPQSLTPLSRIGTDATTLPDHKQTPAKQPLRSPWHAECLGPTVPVRKRCLVSYQCHVMGFSPRRALKQLYKACPLCRTGGVATQPCECRENALQTKDSMSLVSAFGELRERFPKRCHLIGIARGLVPKECNKEYALRSCVMSLVCAIEGSLQSVAKVLATSRVWRSRLSVDKMPCELHMP